MSRLLPALVLALLTAAPGVASAQTRIGNIILTPADPGTSGTRGVSADVPAGMQEIRGRVSVGRDVRLPAGSRVTVTVQEYATARLNTVVDVSFRATKLSAPYQVYFNPTRLNPGRRYAIFATVHDAAGRTLYVSDPVMALPKAQKSSLTLRVRPAN